MYRKALLHIILGLMLLVTACEKRLPPTDWSLTLDTKSKQPFGTYLVAKSVQQLFPSCGITTNDHRTSSDPLDLDYSSSAGKELRIILARSLNFNYSEIRELSDFVGHGNFVMIAASSLNSDLENALRCSAANEKLEGDALNEYNTGNENSLQTFIIKDKASSAKKVYSYRGIPMSNTINIDDDYSSFFLKFDTPEPLIYNKKGNPLVARIWHGNGNIIVLNSPLYFTNHFLLQDTNKALMAHLLSLVPSDRKHIVFDTYLDKKELGDYVGSSSSGGDGGRGGSNSSGDNNEGGFSKLMKYPSWNRAVLLTVLALLLYALLLGRRKQRPIPLIPPIENSSLEFIETIGQLYFMKQSNKNIADKICTHFMEHLRTRYNITAANFTAENIDAICNKLSVSKSDALTLLKRIKSVQTKDLIHDQELISLYKTTQTFKKNK
jgi:hypothetical protein